MEGFVSVTDAEAGDKVWDENGNLIFEKNCAHNVATFFMGLSIDRENDVYVDSQLGAVVGNIDVYVKNVNELEKFTDKKTGKNPYQKYLDMRDKGYELVFYRPFPRGNGGNAHNERGVYCKNYLKFAKKQNKQKKQSKVKEELLSL